MFKKIDDATNNVSQRMLKEFKHYFLQVYEYERQPPMKYFKTIPEILKTKGLGAVLKQLDKLKRIRLRNKRLKRQIYNIKHIDWFVE